MRNSTRHIVIFVFIMSVFSLTLQSSIISFCKESKVFKAQNTTNPVTEEEESHGEDEDVSEVEFLNEHFFSFFATSESSLIWGNNLLYYPTSTKKIRIPPPKFLI